MLRARSEITEAEADLSAEKWVRLLEADKTLLRQVRYFYKTIHGIADLAAWRRDENIPVTYWWYLDVLAQLPELPTGEIIPKWAVA